MILFFQSCSVCVPVVCCDLQVGLFTSEQKERKKTNMARIYRSGNTTVYYFAGGGTSSLLMVIGILLLIFAFSEKDLGRPTMTPKEGGDQEGDDQLVLLVRFLILDFNCSFKDI